MVTIDSIQSCVGWGDNTICIGDTVWVPAGSSDPACGTVVAILPVSWPTIPPSLPTYACLVVFYFGDNRHMFALEDAKTCELQKMVRVKPNPVRFG